MSDKYKDIARKIRSVGPEPYEFYEIDGKCCYEIRGESGEVYSKVIVYLVKFVGKLPDRKAYKFSIEIDPNESLENVAKILKNAKEEFAKNLEIAKTNPDHGKVDLDGGDLGREDDNPVDPNSHFDPSKH